MKVFVVSEFKIQELEKDVVFCDHLCEDLIDILKSNKTCVLADSRLALNKLENDPGLNYLYELDLVRRVL